MLEWHSSVKAKGNNMNDLIVYFQNRGRVVRTGMQPRKPVTYPAVPLKLSPELAAKYRAELAQLSAEFDANYQFSDDYTVWSKHNAIAQQIAWLNAQLAQG